MTHLKRFALLLLMSIAFLIVTDVGDLHAQSKWFTRSADKVIVKSEKSGSDKPHELRRGEIELAPELVTQKKGTADYRGTIKPSRNASDTASISLFPDVSYDVTVESVKHNPDGSIVIDGKIKDHKIKTVVMTVGHEHYLITVQDMNNGLLYRATGDSRTGIGKVREIDMKKMPPMVR